MKYKNRKNIIGRISISRYQGSDGDGISIIVEGGNGLLIIQGDMDIESFGKAITGLGGQKLKLEVFDTFKNIEKKLVNEQIIVNVPEKAARIKNKEEKYAALKEHLAEFETDGWVVALHNIGNHHNWAGQEIDGMRSYRANRYRYVKED